MLTALALAAVVAGVTGTWSPCGLSMVETLAPSGYAGRRAVTLAACATFALGAVVGGVATFGGLAWLGDALALGGSGSAVGAAAIAFVAAWYDLRGRRILPQVRRQVPESWRRVLPVPVAAAGYGVLLGLGFTTFVLAFAVWALAGIAFALGDVAAGVAIGLGFAVGRLAPVVVLAPLADSDLGHRALDAMVERPRVLRGLRALDAVALVACGVAVLAGSTASARAAASATAEAAPAARAAASPATTVGAGIGDPSAEGELLAYAAPARAPGTLVGFGAARPLGGFAPAVGGGRVAWTDGATITLASAASLAPERVVAAAGADAVALSAEWLAWRTRDAILALALADPAAAPRVVARGATLGRPTLDGADVLFHRATRVRSELREVDLASGRTRRLRSARGALLLNPTRLAGALLYVRSSRTRQQLRLRTGARERVLLSTPPTARRDASREPGQGRHRHRGRIPPLPARPPRGVADTLWTTALTPTAAYVTRLRGAKGGGAVPTLLRVAR